jgi:hypothetical protein
MEPRYTPPDLASYVLVTVYIVTNITYGKLETLKINTRNVLTVRTIFPITECHDNYSRASYDHSSCCRLINYEGMPISITCYAITSENMR